MGYAYKERYGFPGNIVRNLNSHWERKRLRMSDFESFDAFVKWCSENGFEDNARLRRYDEARPHGPDNSYWYVRPPYKPVQKISPFCENCQQQSAGCINGCDAWREWFVKNWNENICIKPKEVLPEPPKQGFFQYEHPDLVREGIVWNP